MRAGIRPTTSLHAVFQTWIDCFVLIFCLCSLQYDEFSGSESPATLSPMDLKGRVLLKGKVKMGKQKRNKIPMAMPSFRATLRSPSKAKDLSSAGVTGSGARSTFGSSSRIERLSRSSSARYSFNSSRRCRSSSFADRNSTRQSRGVSGRLTLEDCRSGLETIATGDVKKATDEIYAACLSLRSLPVSAFMTGDRQSLPLPITSVNEDTLLKECGLSIADRHQIEGVRSTFVADHGLTQEQLSRRAIARLAVDPPPQIGKLQQRTMAWLLRPFPLGCAPTLEYRDLCSWGICGGLKVDCGRASERALAGCDLAART